MLDIPHPTNGLDLALLEQNPDELAEEALRQAEGSFAKMTASEKLGIYSPLRQRAKYALGAEDEKDRYQYEKVQGLRKSCGTLKLKDLTPFHHQIIAEHLMGIPHVNIALKMECSMGTVHRVVNDPIFAKMVTEFKTGFTAELEAMFPLVIEAIRSGLESTTIADKLAAARQWTSLAGNDTETSEDASIKITIKMARQKVVGKLKHLIDITPNATE